jgi:gliding motility-associated-like protein
LYTLTVTDLLTGCSGTDQIRVNPNPLPVILVNDATVCPQNNVTLTASGADTYIWSPSTNLNTTTGSSVIATPNASTSYTVTGTNQSTGCSASATATVNVLPVPTGSIQSPGTRFICENGQTVLTAGPIQSGVSLQWLLNGQPIPGATLSSVTVTQKGEYTLQLISAGNCKAMAAGNVDVVNYKKPIVSISGPAGCIGRSLSFQNRSDVSQSGVVTWDWRFGDGSRSTIQNPLHTYTKSGFYDVVLVVRSQTCTGLIDSAAIQVYIQEAPVGIRYATKEVLSNTPVQLDARNIGASYQWTPSVGLNNAAIRNPVFRYDKDVEYLIRIETPSGCQLVDTILLRVHDEGDLLVPSAFSPNGDGVNDYLDVFTLGIKKIHFWVFNRWGQLMFETTDPAQRWDGKYQNKPQPLENYVWIAEAETYSGRIIRKRGQTILIR